MKFLDFTISRTELYFAREQHIIKTFESCQFHYRIKDEFESFCKSKTHKTTAGNNAIKDFQQISRMV